MHDSIEFGNHWTLIVMVGVIFLLVTAYYRRPVHTLIIMVPLLLIPWSDITWAAQTARILLASVAAILVVAILVLPTLFYFDAKRNPQAYGAPPRGGRPAKPRGAPTLQ